MPVTASCQNFKPFFTLFHLSSLSTLFPLFDLQFEGKQFIKHVTLFVCLFPSRESKKTLITKVGSIRFICIRNLFKIWFDGDFSFSDIRCLQIKIDQSIFYIQNFVSGYRTLASVQDLVALLLEHVKSFQIKSYNMMINVNCFYLNESSYYRIHVKGLVLKITSERASRLSSLLTHSVGMTFSPGLFENFHSLNHF